MFQIGNPGLFAVGDPTIFLGYQYWLHKWLPDPPPEARDVALLSYVYALSALLTEPIDRLALEQATGALLAKRLGFAAAPPPESETAPAYTYPPSVSAYSVTREGPHLASERDQFTVVYEATNIRPEGGYLAMTYYGPSTPTSVGPQHGSDEALMFLESTSLSPGTTRGEFTVVRGSGTLEPGAYKLAYTVGTFMGDEGYLPFVIE
jgi:hypothetical protein